MRTGTIGVLGGSMFLSQFALAHAIELSMPVDCVIGENCFIQQYADIDPGPGVRDYRGGPASYDGHKGTDIRVRTLADVTKGVDVLAAAAGRVLRTRDGVPDRIVRSAEDRKAIRDVSCGNGLVIDHGEGWETQYCHLRRGSLRVKPGDPVRRGQQLGQIGYSGLAQFPHLQISVSHKGSTLDPFTGKPVASGDPTGATSLWNDTARRQLEYRKGRLLSMGFASSAVTAADVLKRLPDERTIASNSPALVAYGWWINLHKGDRVITRLTGPDGEIAGRTSGPLARSKAQFIQYSGKKRPAGGWPAGVYRAESAVVRAGRTIMRRGRSLRLR